MIIVVGLYLYRHTTPEIGVWNSMKRGLEFLEKGFGTVYTHIRGFGFHEKGF